MSHGLLKIIVMQTALLLLFVTGASQAVSATPVKVHSIRIVPTKVTVGKYPKITGRVKANKVGARGKTMEVIVIASVVWPDHVMKSWTWKKIKMRNGEIRSFSIPQVFKIKKAGTYKVDFNVYSKEMEPLHRLSKKFVAVDPSRSPAKKKTRKKRAAAKRSSRAAEEYRHMGLGLHANALNSAGGATMLLWPFKYVGLQVSYMQGSFSIAEGRLLARIPRSSGINPYLGVGFISVETERTVEVIDIKAEFEDSGVSGVIGAEIPFSKRLFGYVEVCGAPIELKKEITSGGTTGTAEVQFAPVSVGIGIVYFLF
jgi:hypothetical protein